MNDEMKDQGYTTLAEYNEWPLIPLGWHFNNTGCGRKTSHISPDQWSWGFVMLVSSSMCLAISVVMMVWTGMQRTFIVESLSKITNLWSPRTKLFEYISSCSRQKNHTAMGWKFSVYRAIIKMKITWKTTECSDTRKYHCCQTVHCAISQTFTP